MRSYFTAGDYERAEFIADSLKNNEIYKDKDRVVYALEAGTIDYFQGEYEESIKSFSNAEEYIDQFFTKSMKMGLKAFLLNDNELAYNGEVYEDVYLNSFKSLSYLEMDEHESALIEARRIVHKLEQAESKYGNLASSMSKADTTDKEIEWKAGTSQIHDSPFGRYLSGVLYAKSGKTDDARIELEKLRRTIKNHQLLPDSRVHYDSTFNKVDNPDSYNMLLTAFCGSGPDKVDNSIVIPSVGDKTGLKIAIPKLVMQPSQVSRVEAVINDTASVLVPIIEEMDKVARETFKIKKPIIIARATVRGILKSVGEDVVSDKAEEEGGELLGDAVGFLAGQVREATEQADLRGWQTMPGRVHSTLIKLPPGKHQIVFNYYGTSGQLLFSEKKTVDMAESDRLEPLTSIYSN
ncbi:hypothetical protein [Fodinibius halophilus]|uniref:Tetratricopeptide repeat protein n=1 Tax=Fodinibius halophilus TaxID=1736908 RepID=A0A6M1T2S1_9BACT|nr:hypothetical protein [Fodinibius halophilus]NGP87535.1 hypothetical protein [Fodinibius halophilus]